jgi:hypothetical protein
MERSQKAEQEEEGKEKTTVNVAEDQIKQSSY